MQLEIDWIKSSIASAYRRLFGGRIARTTFVIRVAVLFAAGYLMAAPINTVLAPSSQILKDLYLLLFFAMLALCLMGFASAYVKRLHDIGFRGYWALVALIGIPGLVAWGISSYGDYRWRLDNSFNTADTNELAGWIFLALPLLVALWKGEPKENRFGPVPQPVEHFTASKFNIAAVGAAAAILIPLCIYVGLFQHGVWVGRGATAPTMPLIDSMSEGRVFMKCWNMKGVGAGSGEGSLSGVYRDSFEGVFDFVQMPDGRIDIIPAGQAFGKSYIADGFRIVHYGLPDTGSGYFYVGELNQFMLAAIFDQGGPDAATNYTTFTFGRSDETFPEFQVVMTSAISSSENAVGLAKFPRARGRLMVGDCMAA
jgi:uncharacterized membrane protein YhaH (DUF805 family)